MVYVPVYGRNEDLSKIEKNEFYSGLNKTLIFSGNQLKIQVLGDLYATIRSMCNYEKNIKRERQTTN